MQLKGSETKAADTSRNRNRSREILPLHSGKLTMEVEQWARTENKFCMQNATNRNSISKTVEMGKWQW